jgi:ribA/ribD-fused uncharacterized protein
MNDVRVSRSQRPVWQADRLFFYSSSADTAPGRGVHEVVAESSAYHELARIQHWRRMLSNFWPADFAVAGRTYRTVEHAFQAAKIALADPGLAAGFALESGTSLAQGDGGVARKQRKLVLLDAARLEEWERRKHAVRRDAMHAKFSQHNDLRAVLLATSPAELWHGAGRGQAPQRVFDLEAISEALRPA